MARLLLIVNPAAGTGFALTTMEKLEEILRAKNTEYRVIRTERPGHGTEIAAELAKDDEITAVVSVGGDGTAGGHHEHRARNHDGS